MNQEDQTYARVLWEYHKLYQPLKQSDVLLVLGSHDLRVAEYAAEVYTQGFAPLVIVSGGIAHVGDLLETGWTRTEAEEFADVMRQRGVPQERLLLEKEAQNTGDNFRFSQKLLEEMEVLRQRVLIVTKPCMERRAYATGLCEWPNAELTVTSPPMDFDEFINGTPNPEAQIHIMVGDLQRLIEYPKLGYQIEQVIPDDVLHAYEALKRAGYVKHLLR